MQPFDGPDLIIFLAILAGLALALWLIARRLDTVPPVTAKAKPRKPKYPPKVSPVVAVHPTDYAPITSARGNRKRDLIQMLTLSGRPTSGRQRVVLRKSLNHLAQAVA